MQRLRKKNMSLIVIKAIFDRAERNESACLDSCLTRECSVEPFCRIKFWWCLQALLTMLQASNCKFQSTLLASLLTAI